MLRTWHHILGWTCVALSLAIGGFAVALTRGLIEEYGDNVDPMTLAGQVSIVAFPAMLICAGVAWWAFSSVSSSSSKS